jgi:Fur family transcriptional regulator, peroxide stress response regulator
MRPTRQLIETIRSRGGKVTPQRLAVYAALEADASHPSAEAIYERVHATMPTVSLATVYKALNELVAWGELRRFDVHGMGHFDTRTDPHAEAVCLACNLIVDVPATGIPHAPALPDFEIVSQTETYYGYCTACRDAHTNRA